MTAAVGRVTPISRMSDPRAAFCDPRNHSLYKKRVRYLSILDKFGQMGSQPSQRRGKAVLFRSRPNRRFQTFRRRALVDGAIVSDQLQDENGGFEVFHVEVIQTQHL